MAALDRVTPNQLGHRRAAGRQMVDKVAQATVFFRALKKRNAPAVLVLVGDAPAHGKATEAKGHIGGVVAVQAQKLAHGEAFMEARF